jgi:hypothetical protein
MNYPLLFHTDFISSLQEGRGALHVKAMKSIIVKFGSRGDLRRRFFGEFNFDSFMS